MRTSQASDPLIVRSFWHGTALSIYEVLSIRSFIARGHPVEIFAYDVMDVPVGATVRDAAEILPRSDIFAYSGGRARGSFTAVSNLFRYLLLLDRGGIWSDLDVLCQRPLTDLPSAFVGWESERRLGTAVMSFPRGHPIAKKLVEEAKALGRDFEFGEAGPKLLTRVAGPAEGNITRLEIDTFYPVEPRDMVRLLDPRWLDYCEERTRGSHCVHWWNTGLRVLGLPKDALPPAGSFLYERARLAFGDEAFPSLPLETARRCLDRARQGKRTDMARRRSGWPSRLARRLRRVFVGRRVRV